MSRTTTKIIIAQEDGTVVGQYFLGQGEHLIGREAHCTIQLEATHVSREHAKLIISADAIEIEDLGSTSGTSLDGISVKGRIPIQPGQKLWISDLYIDIERQGFGGLIEGSRLGDGRFTLKRELGKGGMGAVWLALYEETQEHFALKLVSGEISLDPKCLKELQREVNKSHNLVHPNIVRMGYFWKEEGEPAFISLEYVDGTDLHQLRSDSPDGLLAWKDIQTYMLQLCDALEYAHTQKVAHRDIKPSNFMIDREGNLKLADFGIAATLNSSSLNFTSSSVLGSGTPPYMSPQQLDGKRPQVTDDIYSVGATFYDLLTSKPPFHQGDISYQVRHTEVTPMAERLKELNLENDIPEHVNAIVMACLQKDPTQRPQSMRVIREWITSGEEVAVEPEKVSPTSARETQRLDVTPAHATGKAPAGGSRKKWVYGIAAVVAVIVGAALFFSSNVKIGTPIWEFETGSGVWSSPAIGSDGTVYVGSYDKKLYAINGKSGVKLWEFETGFDVYSSPAIGSDGTVYVGSEDKKLYAINGKSGVKLWEFETGDYVTSSPAIGSDGTTIYVGSFDNKLYAINGKSGVKLWEFETGGQVDSSPAIGTDGTVYVGSYDKKLYALSGKSGDKLWEFETGGFVRSSPAIGSDGTVYVGSWDKKLYAINGKSGVKLWEFETGDGVTSSPAIGSDGTVYVGSFDKKLYAINGKSGVKLWEFETGSRVTSSPAIGSDGTVYVGSSDHKLYAINGKSGAKLWEFETGGRVYSSPAIGSDGTVYVGSQDGKLYAIKTDSKGLAKSPWPMRGQNALHTGRVMKK